MDLSHLYTQDLTIWTAGVKDLYGNATYAVTNTVCRWEDKQVKSIDFTGNEIISNAIIYLDEDLSTGDYLYQGTSVSATPLAAAKEVRNFSKSPSLDGESFIRKAIL